MHPVLAAVSSVTGTLIGSFKALPNPSLKAMLTCTTALAAPPAGGLARMHTRPSERILQALADEAPQLNWDCMGLTLLHASVVTTKLLTVQQAHLPLVGDRHTPPAVLSFTDGGAASWMMT